MPDNWIPHCVFRAAATTDTIHVETPCAVPASPGPALPTDPAVDRNAKVAASDQFKAAPKIVEVEGGKLFVRLDEEAFANLGPFRFTPNANTDRRVAPVLNRHILNDINIRLRIPKPYVPSSHWSLW
ncbi:hypothetical protein NX059_010376 [Plenodomus lindquistii]|nr:hypothetical protein NX059_010376 [Plenodomus lindquistii]